jgi:hypothetical protein
VTGKSRENCWKQLLGYERATVIYATRELVVGKKGGSNWFRTFAVMEIGIRILGLWVLLHGI